MLCRARLVLGLVTTFWRVHLPVFIQTTQPGHPSVAHCGYVHWVPEMVLSISGKKWRLWIYDLMLLYRSVCTCIKCINLSCICGGQSDLQHSPANCPAQFFMQMPIVDLWKWKWKVKVTFCIAYCYETIIFQYTIVTDRQSGSTAYRLQARPAPTGPGLWLTAMPRPNLPFNGLHLRNPCKLHGSLLIYRPRRDGRLSWPSWLTHSGRLTHEVVTRQPWIRRRSGKVRQLHTDVLTTEPCRQPVK